MPVDQIGLERTDIKIWERITITVFSEGGKEDYTSRIHDITPTEIIIGTPIRNGVYVPFLNDAVVRVIIPREDGFYSFTTVVVKKTIGGISTVHLKKPSIVERNQRRDYLRVPVSFPVAYLILPPEDEGVEQVEGEGVEQVEGEGVEQVEGEGVEQQEEEEIEEEPLVGTALDISGGGMAIEVQSRDGIEIGTEFVLGFSLSGSQPYEGIIARVVNTKTRGPKAAPLLGLMFIEIDKKDREEIIRFTIIRERELIRAGRIKR